MNTKHTMNRITLSLLVAAIITTPITTTAGVMDAIRNKVAKSSTEMAENLTPKPSSVTQEFAAKVTEIAENQGDAAGQNILNEVLQKPEFVEITPELEKAIEASAATTMEESLLQNHGEVVVTKMQAVKAFSKWMYNASTTGLSKAAQSAKEAIKAHPYIAGAAVISIVGGFVCYKYGGKIVAAVKLTPTGFRNMLGWLKANPVKSTLATTGLVGLGAAYKFGLFGKAAAYASPFASKGLELGSKAVANMAPYFTKQAAQQGLSNIMAQATLKNAGWVGLGLGAFATGRYLRYALEKNKATKNAPNLDTIRNLDTTLHTEEVIIKPISQPVETKSVVTEESPKDAVSAQEKADQEARDLKLAQELQEQEARTKEEQRLAKEKADQEARNLKIAQELQKQEQAKAIEAIVNAAVTMNVTALQKTAAGVELTQEQASALKAYIKALNDNAGIAKKGLAGIRTQAQDTSTESSIRAKARTAKAILTAYDNLVTAFNN